MTAAGKVIFPNFHFGTAGAVEAKITSNGKNITGKNRYFNRMVIPVQIFNNDPGIF